MGPDGGPYIAINENSGNIELEDNTGTTVAIWDDTNSQWDFQNNPISNVDSFTSNSVNTDSLAINEKIKTASGDSDLSTKLSNATAGDLITVLPDIYTADHTIPDEVAIRGTQQTKTRFDGTVTAGGAVDIDNIRLGGGTGELVIGGDFGTARNIRDNGNGITVNGDQNLLYGLKFASVTFSSGTSDGRVDVSVGTLVTDNGSNNVGDIA